MFLVSDLDYYNDGMYGVIVSRVVLVGIIIRRVVEKIWMIVSNVYVSVKKINVVFFLIIV